MAPRSPQWVNTPVLLEALDRRDQRIRELESRLVRKFASKQKEVARG